MTTQPPWSAGVSLGALVESMPELRWESAAQPNILVDAVEFVTATNNPKVDAGTLLVVIDPTVQRRDGESLAGQSGAVVVPESLRPAQWLGAVLRDESMVALRVPADVTWGSLLAGLYENVLGTEAFGGSTAQFETLAELTAAMGERLGNPVTVERASGELVAYSRHGDRVDHARRTSILGRGMPDAAYRRLKRAGVFAAIDRTAGAYVADPADTGGTKRVAIAVRHRGSVVGYIWLLEANHEYTAADGAILEEFAALAARYLARDDSLRLRLRRQQAALLDDILNGTLTTGLPRRARAAQVDPALSYRLIVVAPNAAGAGVPDVPADLQAWIRAHIDGAVIGSYDQHTLLLCPGQGSAGTVPSLAKKCSEMSTPAGKRALARYPVGVSAPGGLADLPRLHREGLASALVSARVDEGARPRFFDALGAYQLLAGPRRADECLSRAVATLMAHDAANGSDLATTLRVYLDSALNGRQAARTLQIHHNTLSYRLHRIGEITQLDLDDADERLAASLEFRRLMVAGDPESER